MTEQATTLCPECWGEGACNCKACGGSGRVLIEDEITENTMTEYLSKEDYEATLTKMRQAFVTQQQLTSELITRVNRLEAYNDALEKALGLAMARLTVGYVAMSKKESGTKRIKHIYTLHLYAAFGNSTYPSLQVEITFDPQKNAPYKNQYYPAEFKRVLFELAGITSQDVGLCTLEDGYKLPKLNRGGESQGITKMVFPVALNVHKQLGVPSTNGTRYNEYAIKWEFIEGFEHPLVELDLERMEWK